MRKDFALGRPKKRRERKPRNAVDKLIKYILVLSTYRHAYESALTDGVGGRLSVRLSHSLEL